MLRPQLKVFNPRTLCAIAAATFVFHNVNAQVLEADSLALVDVYNTNGGTSWTNSTDWLITPVASWYGVTTTDGRVTHLKLAANGLTGALPAGLAALDSLHVLDVSGNALTAVPNLGVLTAIDSLNVASNRLQFADVVPNVAVADASYMYAPQDSIDSPVNLVVLRGSTFNGAVTVEAGLDNAYQWRRNGESLSGQDEPALQLTCVTPANSGSYTCAITNAAAPLLTLHRRAINLTVNNFTVNAGPDQSICQDGIQLAASVPPIGSGTWSLVTGTGLLSNPIDPFATATNLGLGANTFRWNISNGGCVNLAFDDVVIVRSEPPQPAVAGADKFNCGPSDTLSAITPAFGEGSWSVIQGNGVVLDPLHPNSLVGGLSVGENIFRWQVTNGTCQSVFDEMKIIRQEPYTSATVGSDTSICGLEAGLSSVAPIDGQGWWELAAGTGNIDNIYSLTPNVTGLSEGANVFRWYNDNACAQPIFAEQTITVFNFIYANAGSDTSILFNTFDPFTLGGTSSAIGGDGNYIYLWEISASVDDISAANPNVSFSDTGVYVFNLLVVDGNNCTALDDVTITVTLSDVLNVPSLFTPNNDGNNDRLVIPGVEGHPNSKLQIINRHGVNVFETTAYRNDWDGTPNQGTFIGSGVLPADTYYYVLDLSNGRDPQTGYVVIKR
jgi:gliding motility-associated-like protein